LVSKLMLKISVKQGRVVCNKMTTGPVALDVGVGEAPDNKVDARTSVDLDKVALDKVPLDKVDAPVLAAAARAAAGVQQGGVAA
jgi:hypothetical protein